MRSSDAKVFVFALLALIGFPAGQGTFRDQKVSNGPAGNPISYWTNVRDFGARGDGKSDDTPAVLAAIKSVSSGVRAAVVYFPPSSTGPYYLKTPLRLPSHPNWITLYFDGGIQIGATISAAAGYVFYGNNGGQITGFSKDHLTFFGVSAGVDPIIDVTRVNDFRLENIQISENGAERGILIDRSTEVAIKNVWLNMGESNTTGVPIVIHGGFGIYLDGGGYASSPRGTSPSILITDDPTACNYSGIVRVRGTYLAAHGVVVEPKCGDVNSLTFDDMLYESSLDPFLTIRESTTWENPMVWGIQIRDVNMSDEVKDASGKLPAMVRVASKFRVYSLQITNSWVDGYVCKDGFPISDLEIMSQVGCYVYGQTTGYVVSSPEGVVDTRTVLSPAIMQPNGLGAVSPSIHLPLHPF